MEFEPQSDLLPTIVQIPLARAQCFIRYITSTYGVQLTLPYDSPNDNKYYNTEANI